MQLVQTMKSIRHLGYFLQFQLFSNVFSNLPKPSESFSAIENYMQALKGQVFSNRSLMPLPCELRSFIKLTEERIHLLPCIVTSQRDN